MGLADPRPGDNLYTSSVLAMRPKTGEIVWHYQFTPNDPYDYDAYWELIIADINVDGQPRKVMMQLNRNGFLYVIDRTNGKLISAKPFEKVNWASHVDMKTGRPVETELGKKVRAGEADRALAVGARRQELAACRLQSRYRPALRQHHARRHACTSTCRPSRTWSASATCTWRTSTCRARTGEPHRPYRRDRSADRARRNGARRCTTIQIWSAMLATGGGLLFTGKETGEFIALDADTGKIVWQFQTGSGINAMPVTYTHNGRQYVSVLSGIGGLYWNICSASSSRTRSPQGGSVWTFAVLPE